MKLINLFFLINYTLSFYCESFILTASIDRRNFIMNAKKSLITFGLGNSLGLFGPKLINADDNITLEDSTKLVSENSETFLVDRDNTDVYLYGDITISSCILLRKTLIEAQKESKLLNLTYNTELKPINLYIQSYGGSFLDSLGIVDFIQKSDVPIYSFINGYAASSATLISVVCQKRFISKNSFMLLHQLSSSTSGKFNTMTDEMLNLEQFMDTIKNIYLENSNINSKELDEILKKDIWWNAEKCLEVGIVDKII